MAFGFSDDSRKLEMLYGVAGPGWKPGQELSPSDDLLFRTRSEAEAFAPGSRAVAVAVRYDQQWRVVRPQGAAARSTAGPWSAPAVGNSLGGVTVFEAIPAGLVRPSIQVEAMADWRPRVPKESPGDPGPCPGPRELDSPTMALLA
jgi:hypothetical protein